MARSAQKQKRSDAAPGTAFAERLGSALGGSILYQVILDGPPPDRILYAPQDMRRRDAAIGADIIKGRFTLEGGKSMSADGTNLASIWATSPEDDGAAFRDLHSFAWLRHLAALQDKGGTAAYALVDGWLERFGKWSPYSWAPEIAGERIAAWLTHHHLFLKGRDLVWRSRALSSLARQVRHLARTAHRAPEGCERLKTAARLALAGVCLPHLGQAHDRGLELLRREIRLQILPDGGHASRNPSNQLDALIALLTLADALETRKRPQPGFLRYAIDKMTPMTRYFRHGDGGLALFHGATEDDASAVKAALARDDIYAKPFGFAPHTGYQRVRAGKSLVILDAGPPPPAPYARDAHDSALSFEFSAGRARIFVNCGSARHLDGDWRSALRDANAHTALTTTGERARRTTDAPDPAVTSRRYEDETGFWIDAERKTAQGGGFCHKRRLFLSSGGDDLRGEDALSGDGAGVDFVIRFHIHPANKASLSRDGKSVLIMCANGDAWRFRTDWPDVALEKSVYAGDGAAPQKCEQIVVSGRGGDALERLNTGTRVKWALRRLTQTTS